MTAADVLWEYRQIKAYEYEQKTGKPYTEDDTTVDSGYEEWQASLGISKDRDG
jgi:hypothetical protein